MKQAAVVLSSIAALLLSLVSPASAADCNFDKPVGTCTASIVVRKSTGSKPSFAAEITIQSSAPSCSKVEWYLDNTPHQPILRSTSADDDSVFGTSPISAKNFSVSRCTTFQGRRCDNLGAIQSKEAEIAKTKANLAKAQDVIDAYNSNGGKDSTGYFGYAKDYAAKAKVGLAQQEKELAALRSCN